MESDESSEKKFKQYLLKESKANKKSDEYQRNIFDIEFLANNCKASMKVYTDEYYRTIAASLFGSDEMKDVDKTKLTKRIKYPLEKNMINIDAVEKNNDTSDAINENEKKNQLETPKNIKNNSNADPNPVVSTPVEATTSQNSNSKTEAKLNSGKSESHTDPPKVQSNENLTGNNNTSDVINENEKKNLSEIPKNIKNNSNAHPNPEVSTPVEATTSQNSNSKTAVKSISGTSEPY